VNAFSHCCVNQLTKADPKERLLGHDRDILHDGVIQFTTAIVDQTFPLQSLKKNVKSPFFVKVYVLLPELFVITIPFLLNHVSVAVTDPAVGLVVLYAIVAVGMLAGQSV
jgi:hypothetical protein